MKMAPRCWQVVSKLESHRYNEALRTTKPTPNVCCQQILYHSFVDNIHLYHSFNYMSKE